MKIILTCICGPRSAWDIKEGVWDGGIHSLGFQDVLFARRVYFSVLKIRVSIQCVRARRALSRMLIKFILL